MDKSKSTVPIDLVRRAQQGDLAAQGDLIVAYQKRVAGFAYALLGRADAVEDIAQVVFMKMVRALPRLAAPSQFEAWLFRLARNTCVDHIRRQKLRRVFLPFAPEHDEIAEAPPPVDRAEIEALRFALQKLPVKDRALLALAEQGATQQEMAEATGRSVPAIKARLFRAREKLRKDYRSKNET